MGLPGSEDIPDTMMDKAPIQANQLILPRVSILEKINPMIAAITTKMAVQRAWVESALKAIEMLSRAEPATKMTTTACQSPLRPEGNRPGTHRDRKRHRQSRSQRHQTLFAPDQRYHKYAGGGA